ncbi:hypothetical protein [Halalkalibacterium halodurans]|uniref:hypothetical protein n=1 Tax=Halalkalibacterium halodurans TaxID=86665 RepID=UPI002AA9B5F6|nr:hypothetical protein [Halalkalibacterium halodurans]MDY7224644.1 hypothetical protein [Halalkalibacterium halodurans]MDY7243249.1 hypothetical protein [Halalkalibacterium halodurans]
MHKKKGRVEVIKENDTGLNKMFKDRQTGQVMTRGQFADAIEQGKYEDYHVMKQDGRRIPRSNRDTENLD